VYPTKPTAEINTLFAVNSLYIVSMYDFLTIYDILAGYVFNVNFLKPIIGLLPLFIGTVLHLGIIFPAPEKTPRLFRWRFLVYLVPVMVTIPSQSVYIWTEHPWSPII